jgi:hypothetical protein
MSSLDIALSIAFILSITLNVLFYWYIRKTSARLLFISENLNDLITIIGVYKKHLKSIYEMEMFYGDEILQNLLDHTGSLADLLEDYEDVVYLTEPLAFVDSIQNEDIINEESENEGEERPEEDVLYAGSRRRNS